MVPFDRFAFLGVGFVSHAREIPAWARKEQLDRIAPQTAFFIFRTLRSGPSERRLRSREGHSHCPAQAFSSSAEALLPKRLPSATRAFFARARRFSAVSPMPLLPEVAKGTTVLPPKS